MTPTHPQRFRDAVARELTRLRQRCGLSQTALSQELGIDQSTVSKVESGRRNLDIVDVFSWCEALGLRSEETGKILAQLWNTHGAREKGFWNR